MLRYSVTIFLGALLLFQVQPVISKHILPWFGGTPTVWTTCMLFFQMLLLGGYAYAHLVSTGLRQRAQVVVHLVLILVACLMLPIIPNSGWKPVGDEDPTARILALLTVSVGLPYFVLSTTSPLLQRWFSLSSPGASPYRLYSLSNIGSLLALVSYPFIVEPAETLRTQGLVWSAGFVAFGLLCAYCALKTWNLRASVEDAPQGAEAGPRPPIADWVLWLALPACGSVMLLAVTNQMSQDVSVMPLLWVVPLAVYLVSFILCFDDERRYSRAAFWPAFVLSMAGLAWLLHRGLAPTIRDQIIGYTCALFVCCMVCHGELVKLKPSARHLTGFYLMCSAGGALGGVFVSLIAPRIFSTYLELHYGMAATCVVAGVAYWHQAKPQLTWRSRSAAYAVAAAYVAGIAVLGVALWREVQRTTEDSLALSRSFYGTLRVVATRAKGSDDVELVLQHGRIDHGSQYQSPERRHSPFGYYSPKSGFGLTIRLHPNKEARRVGVIGLGTGMIAAYGAAGDTIRFYEINPDVVRIARSMFTYLADSKGQCEVVLGDGRISLEREPNQDFDVLAVDAFNSDAIPVHLLTWEAFETYLRHMAPDGVIAVNITNRYLDLWPVMNGAAHHFGLAAAFVVSADERTGGAVCWVLLTRNKPFLRAGDIAAATVTTDEMPTRICSWTDDYSNLFQVMTRRRR